MQQSTFLCACGCGRFVRNPGARLLPGHHWRLRSSRPVERLCEHCGKVFSTWPSVIAKGRGRFCSRPCRSTAGRRPLSDLWTRLDKTATCWLWIGAALPNGYGKIGRRRKYLLAHRVAWELTHGAVPDGLLVCHSCDNPRCCNPAHLFLGTDLDNMRDMIAKGRASFQKTRHA